MDMEMKELILHTLRFDIQSGGMDGLSKLGIKTILYRRYVNEERKVTKKEFNNILDIEYAKVEEWRNRK